MLSSESSVSLSSSSCAAMSCSDVQLSVPPRASSRLQRARRDRSCRGSRRARERAGFARRRLRACDGSRLRTDCAGATDAKSESICAAKSTTAWRQTSTPMSRRTSERTSASASSALVCGRRPGIGRARCRNRCRPVANVELPRICATSITSINSVGSASGYSSGRRLRPSTSATAPSASWAMSAEASRWTEPSPCGEAMPNLAHSRWRDRPMRSTAEPNAGSRNTICPSGVSTVRDTSMSPCVTPTAVWRRASAGRPSRR